MKHTISILVEDNPGVLDRIASIFSGKGFNIDTITSGETEFEGISRITLVTTGDESAIESIVKQLNRLIETVKVENLTNEERVERELALVTVKYEQSKQLEIKNLCEIFRGNIVDINAQSATIEVTGDTEKINALLSLLNPIGILEMVRSGVVALKRGDKSKVKQEYIL